MEIMRNVDIKNQDVLDLLNQWLELAFKDNPCAEYDENRFFSVGHPGHHQSVAVGKNRANYISDEYRDFIIAKGIGHNGFPETGRFYDLRKPPKNSFNKEGVDGYTHLDQKMQTTLATRGNALASVYPPGGFISWHNNANVPSYNLIITWSENGNGYWKHVNPNTQETVTVHDKPGWQAKAFYFGSYIDDPKNLVYHMATTDCWRITLSYIFDKTHKQFWQDMIDEIEAP